MRDLRGFGRWDLGCVRQMCGQILLRVCARAEQSSRAKPTDRAGQRRHGTTYPRSARRTVYPDPSRGRTQESISIRWCIQNVRTTAIPQLQMPSHKVRMEVSQKDVPDLHSKPFRIVQVLLNIPLRVHHDRTATRFISQQVRCVREATQVVLLQKHTRNSMGEARCGGPVQQEHSFAIRYRCE
jgi:hypothetical protein